MEDAALALIEAGEAEALFDHLVAMAEVASGAGRADLACLNLRTAGEVAAAAGVAQPDEVRALSSRAEAALSVPFDGILDEVAALGGQLRRMLRLEARRRTLAGSLHPSLRFEYEITGEEFDRFVGGEAGERDAETRGLEREVLAGRIDLSLRQAATTDPGPHLFRVFDRLGLDPVARGVATAALLPAVDERFLRAAMRVWGDYVKREPDVAFLCGLASLNPAEARLARLALEPDGPLASLRVLTLHAPDEGGSTALRTRVRPAAWLVRLAIGAPRPGTHLADFTDAVAFAATRCDRVHDATAAARAFLSGASPSRALVLAADDPDEGLAVVDAAAGGRPLFVARPLDPRSPDPVADALDAAGEAAGLDGVLVVDAAGDADRLRAVLPGVLDALGAAGRRPVVLATGDPDSLPPMDATSLRLRPPSADDQVAAWEAARHGSGDPAGAWREAVTRYPLGLAAIARAALLAPRPAAVEDLLDAARGQMAVRSVRLAQRVPLAFGWEDLVLPQDVLVSLNEIVTYFRYREHVFEKWGFRRKLPLGRALSALFHGPSGTGKTMAAAVLAAEFRVPLFQVNLASIVSKYIGETEKNLAAVFDDAARSKAMLLFDEADSLFARRTTGSTAVDRYSNLEVNFLLQRMEEFDGLAVLTTNLEAAIDPAFKRRIRFKVHFPAPDAALRESLWRGMLRGDAEVDRDVDCADLAGRFDLAGGGIKNAVVRAAFQAAEEGSAIRMRHLAEAAVRECREAGQLVRVGGDAGFGPKGDTT
jgi:hypothetical protein